MQSETSDLSRRDPEGGEEHHSVLQGKTDNPYPLPQQQEQDDSEASNDIWTISWNLICRHHVQPKKSSVPILLNFFDVVNRKYDIEGCKKVRSMTRTMSMDRELSGPWNGFIQFTLSNSNQLEGCTWSGGRDEPKLKDHPGPNMFGQKFGPTCRRILSRKKKQHWSEEKPKLDNARSVRNLLHCSGRRGD